MTRKPKPEVRPGEVGLGGMFRSLGGFLDLISDLAEKEGGEIHRSGELGDKKGVKAVYGFSVRVGGGGGGGGRKAADREVRERQGRGRGPRRGGGARAHGRRVRRRRSPAPRRRAARGRCEGHPLRGEGRRAGTERGARRADRKYRKEVLHSSPVRVQEATPSYRNGVFELKLPKAK